MCTVTGALLTGWGISRASLGGYLVAAAGATLAAHGLIGSAGTRGPVVGSGAQARGDVHHSTESGEPEDRAGIRGATHDEGRSVTSAPESGGRSAGSDEVDEVDEIEEISEENTNDDDMDFLDQLETPEPKPQPKPPKQRGLYDSEVVAEDGMGDLDEILG